MMEKVVVPTVDDEGLGAVLSEHFGRAPYFAVVDIEETGKVSKVDFIPNTSEHFGGSGLPPDRIIALNPNALITYGMGPRAIERFQEAGVAVLRAGTSKLGEVLEAYSNDQLEELTEGCGHARH